MRRPMAAVGSSIFFGVAPGTVAGVIPWWISGWRLGNSWPHWPALRIAGGLVLAAALVFLVQAFIRFVAEGLGTPAPVAPTERLVIGGIYRFVRNPMYLAIDGAILGQALLLCQASLLAYAVFITLLQAAFVRFYEEPGLRRRFGAQYEEYCRAVPAWLPRLRPWHQGAV